MKLPRMAFGLAAAVALAATAAAADVHPNLIFTRTDIAAIRADLGRAPLFDRAFEQARAEADAALAQPIVVPIPKDPAGGFTHEQHQRNYRNMYLAGFMYAVTGQPKYARYVQAMLDQYAAMYPTLPIHPAAGGEAPGKLFWQSLNDTVWLFYTIQAYDCVYDGLPAAERRKFEDDIFRPMCAFFIEHVTNQFDLIHNHGTWMDASVGLTGYALHDHDLVAKALLGSREDGSAGYLRQIRELISPDGFYREGPYYARYALMPFFLFAEAIQHNDPSRNIFAYRDGALPKMLDATLQQTSATGAFFPLNDSLKDKTLRSEEVVDAADIAFRDCGRDPALLSIAELQGQVMLGGPGLAVALALRADPSPPPFVRRSENYSDGPDGTWGGLSILRSGPPSDQECLVFKYTSHGLSHGHYDKLTMLFYDQDGREIIQDYGSARFLNVLQKDGGRYLPENKSYAMQTIAQNTVVVDGRSDYDGKIGLAAQHHPDGFYFSDSDPAFQVTSAIDDHAYPGVRLHRTLAMIRGPEGAKPIVVDVFRASSAEAHQYDLPFYYMGQPIAADFPYTAFTREQKALGTKNGYQHLWVEGEGAGAGSGTAALTWLNGGRYYSITTAAGPETQLFLTRIGAGDPHFDLRPDPGFLLRVRARAHVFASVIEPHGAFDPNAETSVRSESRIESVRVLGSSDSGTVVAIAFKGGPTWTLLVANDSADPEAVHRVPCGGRDVTWKGPIQLRR